MIWDLLRIWYKTNIGAPKRKNGPYSPSIYNALECLTVRCNNGLSYSSINTARGALSALDIKLDDISVGSKSLVKRYMKGVYNIRPTRPSNSWTWVVSLVLQQFRKWSLVKTLSLKILTLKLTMLIALKKSTQAQSIHFIHISNMRHVLMNILLNFLDC